MIDIPSVFFFFFFFLVFLYLYQERRSGRAVRAPDLKSVGPRFNEFSLQPRAGVLSR